MKSDDSASSFTVHIVEDEPHQRRAMALICEQAGFAVETYRAGEEFLDCVVEDGQGCVLLDLNLGDMGGENVHRELIRRGWRLPVIICTGEATIESAITHLKMGAAEYLMKPVQPEQLVAAIARARDELRLPAPPAPRDPADVNNRVLRSLTPREREVVDFVVEGRSTKEIAATLRLSEKTVANHRQRVLDKTGAPNTAALVRMVLTARSGEMRR